MRILDLVSKEETDGLDALLASVHIITKEQVVAMRRMLSQVKKPQQVFVLPVNVADDLYWPFEVQKHRLRGD